jgi:phosphotransferase system  glucose/maltose/N-acetylglucosamine-specific IIC component
MLSNPSVMRVMLASDAASSSRFSNLVAPIVELLNSVLGPLLAVVGALGAIYCVILGVKFAKAEEPQDREKAKGALKNAIIGFVLIFVLILALKLLMPTMIDWVNSAAKSTVITPAS